MTSTSGRDELSRALYDLRAASGMTLAQVAELSGLSPATLSRYENGRYVPTADAVRSVVRALGVARSEADRLAGLADDVREETSSRLVLLRGTGMERKQDQIARIEAQSARIATFGNTLVPGLLQTERYARLVFASAERDPVKVDAATAARMRRHEQAVSSTDRQYVQIVTEGALHWCVGGPAVMVEQVEHLIALATAGNPRFVVGVIPHTTPVAQFPLETFDLYDARAAMMGTFTATAVMTTPVDVLAYQRLFEEMTGLADFGPTAVPTFERVGDQYRAMTRI